MTSRINLGLDRISRLLQRLDNPQKRFDVIHVAGTNGKGSVAAMIANTLSCAGIKTGLFTSPHLKYRWDGIRIGQHVINPADYARISDTIKQESEQTMKALISEGQKNSDISTFERLTAAAFTAFREKQIQMAVVEVGLGGLHDATNVVQPIMSVITSIGMDHESFLGSSIQEITRAKGGIIKQGVPVVVSSDQEHSQVFGVLGSIQREVNPGHKLIWTPPNSTTDFQISNRNTARTALECLRDLAVAGKCPDAYNLSSDSIEAGLRTTTWPGRCTIEDLHFLGGPERTLIDGAHNKQSIEALRAVLTEMPTRPRIFILAATKGKDLSCLHRLFQPGDKFFTVEFENVDEMEWIEPVNSSDLCSTLQQACAFGIEGKAYGTDVLGAIQDSRTREIGTELVICGSLYLVGQVYRLLETAEYEHNAFSANRSNSLESYDPIVVENKVQQYWNNLPPTNPEADSKNLKNVKFLLPPPNVTGSLHIGHALTVAIQDAYCRHYRNGGYKVRWVPGIDHAGIATQSVVSKSLAKSGVLSKDLERHDFIAKIWDWRRQYGAIITEQIKRLGTSLDWTSEYFTMDEPRVLAVHEAFRKLWEAGLISRQNRMVNWSVPLQSVISDIEVDSLVIEAPTTLHGVEYGKMWRIRYELADPTAEYRYLEVDTTRPETVLGDRAIAVHPADDRYTSIIGQKVKHPLLPDVLLIIIADPLVKQDFGTGCVKLTPAHDANDYEIVQRHSDIPFITVYGRDGKMLACPDYPELKGMDRLIARVQVVALLDSKDALVSTHPHKTTLSLCSRSGAVIEPLIIPQWYIAMQGLADSVRQNDDIKMTAKTSKEWTKWLSNVQDWCVSRQLIWGHRIPLWRVVDPSSTTERWVFGTTHAEATSNAGHLGVVQDTDVLDTWFSSALLPLSAFGWPRSALAPDHKLEFIESGPDILFFWLARMAMLCTFITNSSPFNEIVLHPLIRDSQGRKMSKSLGNVIDPLSLIEGRSIELLLETLGSGNLGPAELKKASKELRKTYSDGMPAYGADALRFALVQSTVQDEALKFDARSMTSARYLSTKIWNSVNFYLFNLNKHGLADKDLKRLPEHEPTLADHWILLQLQNALDVYEQGFENRQLWRSTEVLRKFTIDQFCDVYLEFVKVDLRELSTKRDTIVRKLWLLRELLRRVLRLYAPFMPHLTEYLWHVLGTRGSVHCQPANGGLGAYISALDSDSGCHRQAPKMEIILNLLHALRKLPARTIDKVTIIGQDGTLSFTDINDYLPHLRTGASLPTLEINAAESGLDEVVPVTKEISIRYSLIGTQAGDSTTPSSSEQRALIKLEKLRKLVAATHYKSRVPEEIRSKHEGEISTLETQLKRFI